VSAGLFVLSGAAAAVPADPVQQAACDFGRQLTTYDYAAYDDYDQRVLDRSTGVFHDDFQSSAADRRDHVLSAHTRAEAVVVECRTDTADPAHADAVVSVDQTTRSDATLGLPQPSRTVMRVSFDNVDGRWLAVRVAPV
jgi:Mce-associated membrane protein